MNLIESMRTAMAALRANKLRSLLTMLGIIIGVGAVIGMLAIGNGFRQYLDDQFAKLGNGVVYIFPGTVSRKLDNQQPPQLTAADAAAIMEPGAVPAAAAVTVEFSGSGIVSAGQRRYTYNIRGLTPSYFRIVDNDLGAGRYYNEQDEQAGARVAVLGREVAERLFGSVGAAVGERMTINGVSFEVIGVLTTKQNLVGDPSKEVYVPYLTARNRLFRNQLNSRVDVQQIVVKAHDPAEINTVIDQASMLLRQRHRLTYQDNDFTMLNPDQIAAQVQAIIGGFSAFLGIVGGIALLVGGIGIMNIMLVSVAERTREIGLRKAVGARRRDILAQFLVEAVVLCLFGGALGIVLGYGFSLLGTLVLVTVFQAEGAVASVTMDAILLATLVSGAVGICFGFFPALQAARLHPIEALRYE